MIAQYFIVLTLCYGVMMVPQGLNTTEPTSGILSSSELGLIIPVKIESETDSSISPEITPKPSTTTEKVNRRQFRPHPRGRIGLFHPVALNWTAAEEKCVKGRGHLLILLNKHEKKHFQRRLQEGNVKSSWLGIKKEAHNKTWVTVTGTPISYESWSVDHLGTTMQPDHYDSEDQYCGVLNNFGMAEMRCADLLPYFCVVRSENVKYAMEHSFP